MKAEYDLSKMKSRPNPYAAKLKKPVTMRLGEDVLEYFKEMAEETGVPARRQAMFGGEKINATEGRAV